MKQANHLNGSDLVQRFIDALSNLLTMERAKVTAEHTEAQLLEQIGNLGSSNGVYTTSNEIPAEQGESLLRESFNAHLTKVQSNQITQKIILEIERSQQKAIAEYTGKKVSIRLIKSDSSPFDAVYVDKNSNQPRVSLYKTKMVRGTIHNISFENNLLILNPDFTSKLLVPNRKFIHVYILDIQTMTPNVDISI